MPQFTGWCLDYTYVTVGTAAIIGFVLFVVLLLMVIQNNSRYPISLQANPITVRCLTTPVPTTTMAPQTSTTATAIPTTTMAPQTSTTTRTTTPITNTKTTTSTSTTTTLKPTLAGYMLDDSIYALLAEMK